MQISPTGRRLNRLVKRLIQPVLFQASFNFLGKHFTEGVMAVASVGRARLAAALYGGPRWVQVGPGESRWVRTGHDLLQRTVGRALLDEETRGRGP